MHNRSGFSCCARGIDYRRNRAVGVGSFGNVRGKLFNRAIKKHTVINVENGEGIIGQPVELFIAVLGCRNGSCVRLVDKLLDFLARKRSIDKYRGTAKLCNRQKGNYPFGHTLGGNGNSVALFNACRSESFSVFIGFFKSFSIGIGFKPAVGKPFRKRTLIKVRGIDFPYFFIDVHNQFEPFRIVYLSINFVKVKFFSFAVGHNMKATLAE